MFAARERLGQLLALAAERRWTPLARELCDLVLYWPADFPAAMRGPIMALFETALCECDGATQSELAARLTDRPDIPLRLMNVLYLSAPAPLRREILMRNELNGAAPRERTADTPAILATARQDQGDFTAAFSTITAVPRRIVQIIFGDASGEPLAVLCRGLGLDRATFSALALLHGNPGLPLSVFDSVPDHAAACLVHGWRKRLETAAAEHVQAAE